MIIKFLNIIIILLIPFLMLGIINKTKAFWAGRKGASVLQPFFDFVKLMKKDFIISSTTSWIFKITPVMVLATTIFASLFAPILLGQSVINITGAFIIFAYILGLGKFFSLISAMDTGSSFEGMGASREACFSTIVEPAFFIVMASIIALTGNYTFESLSMVLKNSGNYGFLIIAFAALTLIIMLLIEGCRVPVDDPNTHLELTMIHEVMILDNSAMGLGLITWASAIKMFLLQSIVVNLLIPSGLGLFHSVLLYFAILFAIAVVVGTVESIMARVRMSHVFEFIFIMTSLALVILSLVAIKLYGS